MHDDDCSYCEIIKTLDAVKMKERADVIIEKIEDEKQKFDHIQEEI